MDKQYSTSSSHLLSGIQRLFEAGLILSTAFTFFLLLALVTFDPTDPGWSQTGVHYQVDNLMGPVGAWFADILLFFFGWIAYVIPPILAWSAWLLFKRIHNLLTLDYFALGLKLIGVICLLLSLTGTSTLNFDDIYSFASGGVIGDIAVELLLPWFRFSGTVLILTSLFLIGFTFVTGISWLEVVDRIGAYVLQLIGKLSAMAVNKNQDDIDINEQPIEKIPTAYSRTEQQQTTPEIAIPLAEIVASSPEQEPEDKASLLQRFLHKKSETEKPIETPTIRKEPQLSLDSILAPTAQPMAEEVIDIDEQVIETSALKTPITTKQVSESELTPLQQAIHELDHVTPMPTLELLERNNQTKQPIAAEDLDRVSALVEAKLLDFNIQAKVVGVYPGPVITLFELELAPGIKVSKITGLSKDLARSLSAMSVRVVEVIPGKAVVGLEIPNKHREMVLLSEVLSSNVFIEAESPLTMVLGADISGNPIIVDLAKMPHLLVAGTTGSGKSVGVNTMIISMLYKSTPKDVRFIMIDPKMLELSVYEGIPHLLTDVVTDMKDAANSLRWCVGEMERRYKLMSALGVRNIKGYNVKVITAAEEGEPIRDPLWRTEDSLDDQAPVLEKLPFIVVVIDEFADMMMIVGKKVEELIARIAQKARAAGIHLVLATQRPSVDVITGLIKANIPTRIAFQVSSRIDSRTILDQLGAENLLGQGDMLYLPPGTSIPVRVHGAFVDDHEVHAVVADWKKRERPQYIQEIVSAEANADILLPGEDSGNEEDNEQDEFYDQAVAFVIEGRRASVSGVQRKFRIGYNRAARLVEQMERSGIVSVPGHNGNREVLVPAPNQT